MIGLGLLTRTVELSIATLYAAMGGVLSERSGIVAVGLEGMMLMGAFFGHLAAWLTGSVWIGLASGIGAGALTGAIHAYATVTRRGDQIVSGVALNIVALGVTTYLLRQVYGGGAVVGLSPGRGCALRWAPPGAGEERLGSADSRRRRAAAVAVGGRRRGWPAAVCQRRPVRGFGGVGGHLSVDLLAGPVH
jgi:hypothetical protein